MAQGTRRYPAGTGKPLLEENEKGVSFQRHTITPAHQNKVKYYVSQLSQAAGQHPATIYGALYTVFKGLRYQELLEV